MSTIMEQAASLALRRRTKEVDSAFEAHGKREGTSWHRQLPAPWRWCSCEPGAFYAKTGLVYAVSADDALTSLTIHAAPTQRQALTGTHHEPMTVDITGKGVRSIGVAVTQVLRYLEHIERTTGLDRGLAV